MFVGSLESDDQQLNRSRRHRSVLLCGLGAEKLALRGLEFFLGQGSLSFSFDGATPANEKSSSHQGDTAPPGPAHYCSMKLTRRRRTDLAAAVESALIGMMTAFWLTRLLRRGWRVAR
jgi:hypothetical protein